MFLLLFVILAKASALKVLVAGDQHDSYFESIAQQVKSYGHTVYKLSRYIQPVFKSKSKDGIILYGIGHHKDKFKANGSSSVQQQQFRLDLELTQVYF